MIKHLVCANCGKEFTINKTNGGRIKYCSVACRRAYHIEQRKSLAVKHNYLKGDKNPLDLLLKRLDEEGISFSDYKKQLALSSVEKIDVNIDKK